MAEADPIDQLDGQPILNDVPQNERVNTVQIKIPPFWKADPALWFIQIEAQFATANIRADLSKYNQIVGKLDPDTLTAVSDIVKNPPAQNKYQALKNRLTNDFKESDRKKLKTLFSDLSLNEDKPSTLLRKMKDKSCDMIGDDLLLELWSNRLPHQIQGILACSIEPLAQQVIMADKIYETMDSTSIQALSKEHPQFDGDLAQKICQLEAKVDSLNRDIKRARSRTSSSRRHRSLSRSTSRSSSRSKQNPNTNCWYHKLYKGKAKKCIPPCSYNMDKHSKN